MPRAMFRQLFLINFAISLGFGITDAFFSVYLFGLGARGLLLALPLVLYSISKILFSPFMGAVSDRVGRRRTLLAGLGLYLLVSVCYLFTTSLPLLAILRVLQGVSCAMFRPVLFSLVGECCAGERRGTAMGTFDISFYAALGLGPVVGGIIKDTAGFRGIFVVLIGLCILALALALPSLFSEGTGDAAPDARADKEDLALRALSRQRSVRGLLAFVFGRACGISMLGAFLPIMLSSRLGLTSTETGIVMASSTAVMTLMLRPAGLLADRAPRRVLVAAGGTMVSLLYFLVPAAAGFNQALLLALGIGLSSVLSQPPSAALLAEEGSRHGMGVTVGACNSVLNLGFVAGPILGAGAQSTFGLAAAFYLAGALGFVAVFFFVKSAPVDGSTQELLGCGCENLPRPDSDAA